MKRSSVQAEIEAFLARQNEENDEVAFAHPRDFRAAVMVQPAGERGTFRVDDAGITVQTPGDRRFDFMWEDIFRIEFKPHSVKLYLRYEPVVTIHGAVRAAIIGLFNQMEEA